MGICLKDSVSLSFSVILYNLFDLSCKKCIKSNFVENVFREKKLDVLDERAAELIHTVIILFIIFYAIYGNIALLIPR